MQVSAVADTRFLYIPVSLVFVYFIFICSSYICNNTGNFKNNKKIQITA